MMKTRSRKRRREADTAVTLSVIFFGENLNPDELSKLLQMDPDRARRVGENRYPKFQPLYSNELFRGGLWIIKSELVEKSAIDHADLRGALNESFTKILPRLKMLEARMSEIGFALDKLPGVDGAYADYFVFKEVEEGVETCHFELDNSQIKMFTSLKLPVSFTVQIAPRT